MLQSNTKNKRTIGKAEVKQFVLTNLREARPMLIFITVYFISFYILEHMTRLHYYVIESPLDRVIPFCEAFILPYLSWFPYMVVGAGLLLFFDKPEYRRLSFMLYLGMGAFIVISALFPNILYLRPEVMPRDNIFTRMVAQLYRTDTPTNVTPSIHVFNTLTVVNGIAHSQCKYARKKWVRAIFYLDGILIILSTMFIKQHSVYDVAAAFLMFSLFYIPIYRPDLLPGRDSSKKLLRTEE
jgi:membrane-associated phospholipid phosphatase